MLAALGPHRFALHGVPIGKLSRTAAPRVEAQGVIGGLPVRHVTGREFMKLTIAATFFPRAMPGTGLSTMEALARDAGTGKAMPFATADGVWRGWFVIMSVAEKREILDAEGRPVKVVVDIELEEDEAPAGAGRLPGLFG